MIKYKLFILTFIFFSLVSCGESGGGSASSDPNGESGGDSASSDPNDDNGSSTKIFNSTLKSIDLTSPISGYSVDATTDVSEVGVIILD